MPSVDPRTLRKRMRASRHRLRPAQQRAAAQRLCHCVLASCSFRAARRIALYIAADGEIDPAPICRAAWRRGKQVFLPVLHPLHRDRMIFTRYRESDHLLPNRFGILEPSSLRHRVAPWQLDLVLVPLVAFDAAGNRLGMGGGFYDRSFAVVQALHWPRRPTLCGLAHRLQQVAALPVNSWDVPLARVFTD